LRARGDCDVCARLGESLGHRQSKPAPAARDQGYTAIEAEARHLKFVVSGHSSFNIHIFSLAAPRLKNRTACRFLRQHLIATVNAENLDNDKPQAPHTAITL
jgi:hypothetical protein